MFSHADNYENLTRHVIQNDCGRRGLGFGHVAFFRNLASYHQISIDTFLFQMKHSDKELYWTMMKLNG